MRNNFIGGMNNISIRCKNIGKKSNSSICKKMEWLNKCPKKLTYVSRCNWTKLGGGLTTNDLKIDSWLSTFLIHCT